MSSILQSIAENMACSDDEFDYKYFDHSLAIPEYVFDADNRDLVGEEKIGSPPYNGIAQVKTYVNGCKIGTGFLCNLRGRLTFATCAHNVCDRTSSSPMMYERIFIRFALYRKYWIAALEVNGNDFYIPEEHKVEADEFDYAFLDLNNCTEKDMLQAALTVFDLDEQPYTKKVRYMYGRSLFISGYPGKPRKENFDPNDKQCYINKKLWQPKTQWYSEIKHIDEIDQHFIVHKDATSGGNSGSPVYSKQRSALNEVVYVAVGIHIGYLRDRGNLAVILEERSVDAIHTHLSKQAERTGGSRVYSVKYNSDISAAASTVTGVTETIEDLNTMDYVVIEEETVDNESLDVDMLADAEAAASGGTVSSPESAEPVGEALWERPELRGYQLELAERPLRGENVIVNAPTGSGKTLVAMHVAKAHLDAAPGKNKVVFIVPKVALVAQQAREFEKYLSPAYKVQRISGELETCKVELKNFLPNFHVFVLTPQILVDALTKNEVDGITDFSLLIFDECHHTTENHPYNKIMSIYMDTKSENRAALPQIMGLTASLGVGKASNRAQAVDHVLKVCANMDVSGVVRVKDNKDELDKHNNMPTQDTVRIDPRKVDPFDRQVKQVMKKIEFYIKSSEYLDYVMDQNSQLAALSSPPDDPASEVYTNWVNGLLRPLQTITEQPIRAPFLSYRSHLQAYHEALMINRDCRLIEALEFLETRIPTIATIRDDKNDQLLKTLFKELKDKLSSAARSAEISPKLARLKSMLLDEYSSSGEDMRALVFCTTRNLTDMLTKWMKEDANLNPLNAHRITGSNASADEKGMTGAKREDVLKYFKGGKHKVLLATSVLEEGLDVQKCNLVINYEKATNEISLVQTRGRARKEGSKTFLLTEAGRGAAEKEVINTIREKLMEEALDELDDMDPTEVKKTIDREQKMAACDRRRKRKAKELMDRERQERAAAAGEFILRCPTGKCDTFVCTTSDLRKIHEHYVVAKNVEQFEQKVRKEPRPSTDRAVGRDTYMINSLLCKECGHKWGNEMTYHGVSFAALALKRLVLEDENQRRDTVKKWTDAPFLVPVLSPDEMDQAQEDMD